MTGVVLLRMHPQLDDLTCDTCRLFQCNLDSGLVVVSKVSGKRVERNGIPTPCEKQEQTGKGGCPKGHWREPRSLSMRNKQAYWHYLQCRATGIWPDDGLVLDNAGIIAAAIDKADRVLSWKQQKEAQLATEILSAIPPKGG